MRNYAEPVFKIVYFESKDVIRASGEGGDSDNIGVAMFCWGDVWKQ